MRPDLAGPCPALRGTAIVTRTRTLPQPSKAARMERDPDAPGLRGFWTVDQYRALVYGHWNALADGMLRQAGSAKTVDELPDDLVKRLRSKSADDALREGLRLLNERGKLLTRRQYEDLRRGRLLQPGDLARYIGPTRTERVASASDGLRTEISRPHGQLGYIEHDRRAHRKTPDGRSLIVFVPRTNTSGEPRRAINARLLVGPWRGDYWRLARVLPQEVSDK